MSFLVLIILSTLWGPGTPSHVCDRAQTLEKSLAALMESVYALRKLVRTWYLQQTSAAFHCIITGRMRQVGNQTCLISWYIKKKKKDLQINKATPQQGFGKHI